MENCLPLLYVLQLESNNFYIGVSYHINLSYAKHTAGQASKITKLYRPLCIKEVKLVDSQSDLHKTVKSYRDAHGYDKIFVDAEEDSYEVTIVRKDTNTFVPQTKTVTMNNISSIQETVTADSPKPVVKKIRAPISFKKLQQAVEVFEDVLPADPEPEEVKTEIMENIEAQKDIREVDPETKKLIQKEYWSNQYKKTGETKKKLKQEGKKLNDILTKENLQKWLVDDGRSYSYIAREYAGCTNQMVSDIAKGFGLKSTKSPRDFMKYSR